MKRALLLLAATALVQPLIAAELKDHTAAEFKNYIRKTEAGLDQRLCGNGFLWVDASPEALKKVQANQVVIEPLTGKGEKHVQDGLIHDWVGTLFIPKASIGRVLAAQQNYDNHKNTHKPDVLDSKLLSHTGNDFKVYLQVSKSKAGVTAVLNTDHEVLYSQVDRNRWEARSYSTRIVQLKDAGKPEQEEMPPGNDSGYLWRLNSYWRYVERDGGVYVECQAVSLTRDVPWPLSLIVVRIIRDLPRESLRNTLESTRKAVLSQPVAFFGGAPPR